MSSQYEYQVIEDNGGGLALYVFDEGGINGGRVIYAHASYEHVMGQLTEDLNNLDAGSDVTEWGGCEDEPQALYDELDRFETGWQKVAEGAGGKRTIYPELMGIAAKLEFGVEQDQ